MSWNWEDEADEEDEEDEDEISEENSLSWYLGSTARKKTPITYSTAVEAVGSYVT